MTVSPCQKSDHQQIGASAGDGNNLVFLIHLSDIIVFSVLLYAYGRGVASPAICNITHQKGKCRANWPAGHHIGEK